MLTLVVLVVLLVGSVGRLVRAWDRSALVALVRHEPLGPYDARWWWEEGLLRFVRVAWKALLAIQALFLAALVSADLQDASGPEFTNQWYGGMWSVLSVVLLFLLLGLVFDVAFQIWRITSASKWIHASWSLGAYLFPALVLASIILIGWSTILS